MLIIIAFGSYPERSLSCIIIFVYTSIFTFPFLYVILNLFFLLGSVKLGFIFSSFYIIDPLFTFIIFFTFSVKLPVYGLHYWLPIAHVEAPTFGSMILAGILLKLGGVGLFRFMSIIDLNFLKFSLIGYFLVFLLVSTCICCFQSDFKRLVAYSSVSHIICIPIIFIRSRFIGLKGSLFLIFMHGFSSPILFILVGIFYSVTSTRQHILMRGVLISRPFISLIRVLSFFFRVSAPPYPRFLSEVFFVFF